MAIVDEVMTIMASAWHWHLALSADFQAGKARDTDSGSDAQFACCTLLLDIVELGFIGANVHVHAGGPRAELQSMRMKACITRCGTKLYPGCTDFSFPVSRLYWSSFLGQSGRRCNFERRDLRAT